MNIVQYKYNYEKKNITYKINKIFNLNSLFNN